MTLKKINMKQAKSYNAFKVFVPHNKLAMFLDDALWPEGVTCRRFVYIKPPALKESQELIRTADNK